MSASHPFIFIVFFPVFFVGCRVWLLVTRRSRCALRRRLSLFASFRFYEDGLRFVGILAILALCGFVYTIVVLNRRGVKPGKITVRGLDLVTTVCGRACAPDERSGVQWPNTSLRPRFASPVALHPADCAPRSAGSHDDWHHVRPHPAQEEEDLLHQPAARQRRSRALHGAPRFSTALHAFTLTSPSPPTPHYSNHTRSLEKSRSCALTRRARLPKTA